MITIEEIKRRLWYGAREDGQCQPLSLPKVTPVDVSKIIIEMEKNLNGDAHSHSYLTLKELKDSIYCKETPIKAWIYRDDAFLIKNGVAEHLYYLNFEGDNMIFAEWKDKPNFNFLLMIESLEQKKRENKIENDSDIRIVLV